MSDPVHLIDLFYSGNRYKELTAGFESSSVLVRKVGDSNFDWPCKLWDVVTDKYPTTPDHNFS